MAILGRTPGSKGIQAEELQVQQREPKNKPRANQTGGWIRVLRNRVSAFFHRKWHILWNATLSAKYIVFCVESKFLPHVGK